MMLEDIARTYGMTDYYDNIGGKIYQLSQATEAPDNSGGALSSCNRCNGR